MAMVAMPRRISVILDRVWVDGPTFRPKVAPMPGSETRFMPDRRHSRSRMGMVAFMSCAGPSLAFVRHAHEKSRSHLHRTRIISVAKR